jgi:hypothetical protein
MNIFTMMIRLLLVLIEVCFSENPIKKGGKTVEHNNINSGDMYLLFLLLQRISINLFK